MYNNTPFRSVFLFIKGGIMTQSELDDLIGSLRTEKLMLIKSKEKVTDDTKIKAIEKRILEVNKQMMDLREKYKKEKEENERN